MSAVRSQAMPAAAEELLPALDAQLGGLHPDLAAIARYHRTGRPQALAAGEPGMSGKALRSTLSLMAAEAAGDVTAGLAAGVAVELVHDFSLLHDDVMDNDRIRRGRPSAWAAYGVGPAVLAGDGVLVLACRGLLSSGRAQAPAAVERLLAATAELIDGQARDLALEKAAEPSVDACLTMSAAKTGALFGCAAELGALLAGGSEHAVSHLAGFGRSLGIAFQAVDDLLGIWGDERVTGKPRFSDLRRRQRTLPVAYALAFSGDRAAQLRERLDAAGEATDEQLEQLAGMPELIRAREAAEQLARFEAEAAIARIDGLRIGDDLRGRFRDLATAMTRRTR